MLITLRVVLRLVLGRASGHRRLLAAVMVGVILAVGLMSATEIYRNALRERGIDVELSRADKTELDLAVSLSGHGLASPGYEESQAQIDRGLSRIDPFLTGSTRTAVSATFFLTDPDSLPRETRDLPRANLQFLAELDRHIALEAGRLPNADTTTTSQGRTRGRGRTRLRGRCRLRRSGRRYVRPTPVLARRFWHRSRRRSSG